MAKTAPRAKAKPAAKKRAAAPSGARGPAHNPGAFLDLPPDISEYTGAGVVVLPMPLEESVSYGGGTAAGPAAIIAASQQVELYDARRDLEPAMLYGIHTLPVPEGFRQRGAGDTPRVLDAIAAETARHLAAGKFVLGLGGEHTASLGVARGVAAARGCFTLVHIDAHADLRDSYEDNPLSHACVVRRIAELPECEGILQLGIRSTSRDQADFARAHSSRKGTGPVIKTWYAWDMHRDKGWRREFRRVVRGKRVFFTFDVDGLDPAIVPATGTPEPDGLTWRQLMRIARITAAHSAGCVAMDCVELAPSAGLHHADFTVARALYEIVSMFMTRA